MGLKQALAHLWAPEMAKQGSELSPASFHVFIPASHQFGTMPKWHRLGGKKMPMKSEGAMKTSSSRASK
jgi:hypothetical protein